MSATAEISSSEIVQIPSTTTNDSSSQTPTTTGQLLPDVGHQSNSNPNLQTQTNPITKPKWLSLLNFLPPKHKISKPKPTQSPDTATATATAGDTTNNSEAELLALSNLIDQDLSFITDTCKKLDIYKGHVSEEAIKARQQLDTLKSGGNPDELRKLRRTVTKLKVHISSKYKDRSDDPHRNKRLTDSAKNKLISEDELLKIISKFYDSQLLKDSSQFQDFKELYDLLRIELKLSLLCFAVFPEGAVIKKRFMIYWWIGERFVPPIHTDDDEKTAEDYGNDFFYELMEKGFIEPVYKKRNLMAESCRMHPFIRSIVLQLALRAKFFDFGEIGNPTEDFSASLRACLVGEGLVNQQELEKLHMLFNVNEEILDFKPDWFLRMRNINLLSLGRWQTSATHHIELEETNFLDGLAIMNHLRLFSLQGVSRIMELPDSISQLTNLTILDLRACHNLEVIPKGIGLLKSLTHLDMSECYLLEHMPKELSLLSQLQVLKGFVVGVSKNKNSCTLNDLAKLPFLRKLNIYTGLKEFPLDTDLRALQEFKVLRKLTIAWGGGASHAKSDKSDNVSLTTKKDDKEGKGKGEGEGNKKEPKKDDREGKGEGEGNKKEPNSSHRRWGGFVRKPHDRKSLTRQTAFKLALEALEKLDLQCFPGKHATTTNWLTPANLKGLKKLYIRGGKLSDLGQYLDFDESVGDDLPVKNTWQIEVLRLKYLSELEMDWREMQELFPDLLYLEKVNCPKLTLFPCDESGVWMNKTKLKLLEERRS